MTESFIIENKLNITSENNNSEHPIINNNNNNKHKDPALPCCKKQQCARNHQSIASGPNLTNFEDHPFYRRNCCQKKGCLLAAKIVDLYKCQLKSFDKDYRGPGDLKYHYLMSDASTQTARSERTLPLFTKTVSALEKLETVPESKLIDASPEPDELPLELLSAEFVDPASTKKMDEILQVPIEVIPSLREVEYSQLKDDNVYNTAIDSLSFELLHAPVKVDKMESEVIAEPNNIELTPSMELAVSEAKQKMTEFRLGTDAVHNPTVVDLRNTDRLDSVSIQAQKSLGSINEACKSSIYFKKNSITETKCCGFIKKKSKPKPHTKSITSNLSMNRKVSVPSEESVPKTRKRKKSSKSSIHYNKLLL